MARPRVIHIPEGGEVILKNLNPEKADEIKKLILGETEERDVSNEPPASPEVEVDESTLTNSAVGGYRDAKNVWHLVTVRYNPETGECKITKDKTLDRDRALFQEEFKITVVRESIL